MRVSTARGLTWYGSSVTTIGGAAPLGLDDLGLGPHLDRAPAGPVGVHDPLPAQDVARRSGSPGP